MTIEYYKYLEELRESGETNMWGATPYLMRRFGVDRKKASEILLAWIDSKKKV